jgi:FMN phosphatase YigB (HAD superfamily)
MKPILFVDFDGTLCHDKFWRSLEPTQRDRVQQYFFSSNEEMVNQWMRGAHTSEEINQFLSTNLSIPYSHLWATFVEDCKNMFVSKNTLEKIQSLRSTHATILTTDNMDCFDRFTAPSLALHEYFDDVVSSSKRRTLKCDNAGQLFTDIANEQHADLGKSILVDNSKKVCTIFENLGGTSFLVTKEKPVNYWLDTLPTR